MAHPTPQDIHHRFDKRQLLEQIAMGNRLHVTGFFERHYEDQRDRQSDRGRSQEDDR
jgi:hypothetical protein